MASFVINALTAVESLSLTRDPAAGPSEEPTEGASESPSGGAATSSAVGVELAAALLLPGAALIGRLRRRRRGDR